MKTTIESKVIAGFLLSFLIIGSFSLNTFFEMRSLIKENEKHTEVEKILKSIENIKTDLVRVEASGRGYALSGQENQHAAYTESVQQAKKGLNDLILLLPGKEFDPQKKMLSDTFQSLADYADKIIETKHTQGTNAALMLLLDGNIAEYGNRIVLALQKIESTHRSKIIDNTHNNIAAANDTIISFIFLVVIILLILCVIYYLFKKDLTFSRKARADLSKMNEELERRVKIRTEALITSEKKYRLMADNAMDVVSLHSIDGAYTYVSESCKTMSGYMPSELIGRSGYDFIHPDDISFVQSIHMKLLTSSPHSGVIPYRSLKKNGEYTHVEAMAGVVSDANGHIESIILCTRDVSDRVKAENELNQQQQMLQSIMDNSIDPIWSVDKNLNLLDFNESCKYMTGYFYKKEVFVGMDAVQMSDEESMAEWKECYERTLSGEYFSKEVKLISRLEEYYYDVSFNPIIVNEQIAGIAVFARDVTAHKKIEKQLSYKVNELNTFMYKATHDLRSPLVSLMGLVQLAESETAENSALQQYFEMIGRSVLKMDKLLIDLVNITNVSQGKLSVNKIDFNKMTGDILDSLSHHPNFKNISVTRKINETFSLHNDDKLLYSVMQNLIDNAIKYSKITNGVSSMVDISIESDQEATIISIVDNGIGIPAKSQEKVFDMFYRAASVSSGTGLGLYIVKSAVEKMGGKVSLSSKESGGTSIYVTLPNLQSVEEEVLQKAS